MAPETSICAQGCVSFYHLLNRESSVQLLVPKTFEPGEPDYRRLPANLENNQIVPAGELFCFVVPLPPSRSIHLAGTACETTARPYQALLRRARACRKPKREAELSLPLSASFFPLFSGSSPGSSSFSLSLFQVSLSRALSCLFRSFSFFSVRLSSRTFVHESAIAASVLIGRGLEFKFVKKTLVAWSLESSPAMCFASSSSERVSSVLSYCIIESNAQINVRCVTCDTLITARRGTEPETRRFDAACPRVTRLTTAGPRPLKRTIVGAQLLLCRRRRRRRPTREAANCHAAGG